MIKVNQTIFDVYLAMIDFFQNIFPKSILEF